MPEPNKYKGIGLILVNRISKSPCSTPRLQRLTDSKESSEEILKGVLAADIVLLVLAANSPAKQPDVLMLNQFKEYYREHSELKPPRVIGVVTHIDLLRPMQEWKPPYKWRDPKTPKERSIHESIEYCRELFGTSIRDYVPVCLHENKSLENSATEELLELIASEISQGQAVRTSQSLLQSIRKR